jgi:hypothetical protein
MLTLIPANVARDHGPLWSYKHFCETLEKFLWHAIYSKQNTIDLHVVGRVTNMENLDERPWFQVLKMELEMLGYNVSSDGVMSW